MSCRLEVKLLSLSKNEEDISISLQMGNSNSQALPSNLPISFILPSLSMSVEVFFQKNESCTSETLNLQKLFEMHSEVVKQFTFLDEISAEISFKVEDKDKSFSEEVGSMLSPPIENFENDQLKTMLEKSQDARSKLQDFVKNTSENMNHEIKKLYDKIEELIEAQDESSKLLNKERKTLSLVQIELEDKRNQCARLEQELEASHSNEGWDELIRVKEKLLIVNIEKDKIINELLDQKKQHATLNNSFICLKKENSELQIQNRSLKEEIEALKEENASLYLNKEEYDRIIQELKNKIDEHNNNSVHKSDTDSEDKFKIYIDQIESYFALNKNLTSNICELNEELGKKKLENQKLLIEIDKSKAEIARYQTFEFLNKDLNEVIEELRAEISAYKSANQKLTEEISSMSDIISLQSSRNLTAKQKIRELENQISKEDPVDIALKRYPNIKFTKESTGIYHFAQNAQKKVYIKLENGKIILRIEGKSITIDDFIRQEKKFSPPKLQKKRSYNSFELSKATDISPKPPKDPMSSKKLTPRHHSPLNQ